MTLPCGFISAIVSHHKADSMFFTTFDALGIEINRCSAARKVYCNPLLIDVCVVTRNACKVILQTQCDATFGSTILTHLELRCYGRRSGVCHQAVCAER